MRHYETVFIVQPEITEEDYKGVVKKYSDLLERLTATTIRVEEWGTQRLAYRLGKFDKGAYVLLNFCGKSGITAQLERDLKLDDKVLLFQTVKLADNVDPEELLMKEMEARKKRVSETEPAEAQVESGQAEPAASEEGEVERDV